MKKQDHSYLDLSVLPQLRTRVLSSDAVVLFNHDLSNILWANANGAKLFGGRGVVDLLDLDLGDQHALIKQLKKTIAQMYDDPSIVRGFRLNQGSRSLLLQFEITKIALPGDDIGYRVTSHADENAAEKSENELARAAIDSLKGFADAAAIIDDYGMPLAASREFEALGPSDTVLTDMIMELLDEIDRLVKRPETSLSGNVVAVGLARLTEAPGRNLIVLADTHQQAQTQEETSDVQALSELEDETLNDEFEIDDLDEEDKPEQALFSPNVVSERNHIEHEDDDEIEEDVSQFEQDDFGSHDLSLFATLDDETPPSLDEDENLNTLDPDIDTSEVFEAVTNFSTDKELEITPSLEPDDIDEDDLEDDINEDDDEDEDEDEEDESDYLEDDFVPSSFITPDEDVMEDARFSWVTDVNGRFTSLSPELETAVGKEAASLLGKTWQDVANELDIDQDGEIAELLESQDTWSGKGVLWPVSNTDMSIPIDLAALPAFGTNKNFQGFRGFGVIRQLDTIVDPEARGLQLNPSSSDGPKNIASDESTISFTNDFNEEQEDNDSNVVPLRVEEDEDIAVDEASNALNPNESSNFKIIGETLQSIDNLPDPTELYDANDDLEDEIEFEQETFTPTLTDLEPEDTRDNSQIDTSLIVNLPVAVLIHRSNRLLHANKKLLEVTGYDNLEDIEQSGGLDILLDSVEAEDEDHHGQQVLITKSGSKIAINPVLQSVPWQGDKAYMLSFSAEKKVQLDNDHSFELANSQEIQNILDTASDGIIVMNEIGQIDSINSSTEALLGWSNEEASGKDVMDFFAPESKDTVAQYIESASTPGIDSLLNDGRDLIAIERNGGLIPIFLTITKMESSNKYCAVVRDMTSWKKVEEELVTSRMDAERASDQKTNFLAHVSHEIRTPLNAIIGFSDVMLKERFGPVENDRYREYLQDIKRSGAHVLDLVNDLLDLSKIEAGKLELSFEAVELNQLVSETVALLQPQANTNRIIIRTSLSRAVPKVVADKRSMRQIILNLVSNAIKFSSPNSQVIVSTLYETNGEVALRVRDTGTGMNAGEIEEALKPFHQLQNITERKNEGTGLGLPLTKALVEANRAHFDIESMPGQGTIVHVQFPIQRVLTD